MRRRYRPSVTVLFVATVAFKSAGPVLLSGRDLPPRARRVVSLVALSAALARLPMLAVVALAAAASAVTGLIL
jgi:hypothetical protein